MDDTFISYVPEEMNKAYDALKNQVAATQKELEDLGKYYGDARLQEAALGYVKAVEESLPLYGLSRTGTHAELRDDKTEGRTLLKDPRFTHRVLHRTA